MLCKNRDHQLVIFISYLVYFVNEVPWVYSGNIKVPRRFRMVLEKLRSCWLCDKILFSSPGDSVIKTNVTALRGATASSIYCQFLQWRNITVVEHECLCSMNIHRLAFILKLIVLGVYKNSLIHGFFCIPLWFRKGWTSRLKLLLLENQFFTWHCHASNNNTVVPSPVPVLSGFICKKEVVGVGKKPVSLFSLLLQLKRSFLWNRVVTRLLCTSFPSHDPSPVHCSWSRVVLVEPRCT